MASPDAIVLKRVRAMERIKKALPQAKFKKFPQAGAEWQHAADLEVIADALESGKAPTRDAAGK